MRGSICSVLLVSALACQGKAFSIGELPKEAETRGGFAGSSLGGNSSGGFAGVSAGGTFGGGNVAGGSLGGGNVAGGSAQESPDWSKYCEQFAIGYDGRECEVSTSCGVVCDCPSPVATLGLVCVESHGCIASAHCATACAATSDFWGCAMRPCREDADCSDGGRCVVAAGTEVGACGGTLQYGCADDDDCEDGRYCVETSSSRSCYAGEPGNLCYRDAQCGAGTCLKRAETRLGLCSAGEARQTCYADSDCQSGLACVAKGSEFEPEELHRGRGYCSDGSVDMPCQEDSECSSRHCSFGTCNNGNVGDRCQVDDDCESEICVRYRCVAQRGTTITGTLTFPDTPIGTPYAVQVLREAHLNLGCSSEHCVAEMRGVTTESASESFSLPDIPAGAYYLVGWVDAKASSSFPYQGDWRGFYGGVGSAPPEQPNLTVPASGTISEDLVLYEVPYE